MRQEGCVQDHCSQGYRQSPHAGPLRKVRGSFTLRASVASLKRRQAPWLDSREDSNRLDKPGSYSGKLTAGGGTTCSSPCNVPRVSSDISTSICALGRFLMCSSSARASFISVTAPMP